MLIPSSLMEVLMSSKYYIDLRQLRCKYPNKVTDLEESIVRVILQGKVVIGQ